MARIKEIVVRFRPSTSPDVVAYRFRVRGANTVAAYDTPYNDVAVRAPDADGYVRYPTANIPQFDGLEGRYDVHVTAVDGRGNESDFLEIDNQTFDLSPPEAPTDGAIE
jgi:hypothetical protein